MAEPVMKSREWAHRVGDRYIPVFGDWLLDDGRLEHIWTQLVQPYDSCNAAIRSGLRAQGSDDFNIAVVRRGHVVALLWMHDIIDDDPDVLASVEQAIDAVAAPVTGKRT